MTKPRVFVTRILPESRSAEVLAQTDATVWQEELPPPRAVLLDWARPADGLLTLLTDKIDAELLDAAPHLKVVANSAVGFDNFDVPATQRRVLMTNTPRCADRHHRRPGLHPADGIRGGALSKGTPTPKTATGAPGRMLLMAAVSTAPPSGSARHRTHRG
jgi:hypothetical protein